MSNAKNETPAKPYNTSSQEDFFAKKYATNKEINNKIHFKNTILISVFGNKITYESDQIRSVERNQFFKFIEISFVIKR